MSTNPELNRDGLLALVQIVVAKRRREAEADRAEAVRIADHALLDLMRAEGADNAHDQLVKIAENMRQGSAAAARILYYTMSVYGMVNVLARDGHQMEPADRNDRRKKIVQAISGILKNTAALQDRVDREADMNDSIIDQLREVLAGGDE